MAAPLLGWLWFANWTPITTLPLRLSSIVASSLLWGIGVALLPKGRAVLIGATIALALLIGLMPLRSVDASALRESYRAALESYRGTQYVWGGENARGIDCSGLVRRAWRDALWREGARQENPALWREALAQWWFDAAAHDLKDSYRDQLQPVTQFQALNKDNLRSLATGDLAVTQSGQHVLAYLGAAQWIQADPNLLTGDKVIVCDKNSGNPWLKQPVAIRRWKLLSPSPTTSP